MSALNATNAIRNTNPPLEFSKKAIREHLQFHATNGPAYVQIQATKALARMIGLYDDAKKGVNDMVDKAKQTGQTLYEKAEAIRNGTHKVTAEELGDYLTAGTDDEEEGGTDEAEPP